ncbi:MAG: beta-mannosidase [bacterium]
MKHNVSSRLLGFIIIVISISACEERPGKMIVKLHDNWKFKESGKDSLHAAGVPGTVHTDLLRAGLIEDPFYRDNEAKLQWIGKTAWEYQTQFIVQPELLNYENVELVFKGLDTYTAVFLNDALVLETDNMFREWRADCKSLLKNGENTLRVSFRSPINEILPKMQTFDYELPAVNDHGEKTSPYTRKAPYHYGWDWGPRFVTCGIWQPVYLEAWDSAKITDLHVVQNQLDEKTAKITAHVEVESTRETEATIEITSQEGSCEKARKTVKLIPGVHTYSVEVKIDKPKFWWPNGLGEQHLYTIAAKLSGDNLLSDHAEKRIGLRTIELSQQRDAFGKSFEFVVNGLPVFAKGGNWIPADNFTTRIDRKKYEQLIRSAKDANMNMLRVWGGGIYENDDFYELCDELGIMVWQDFMFACSMYPATPADSLSVESEAIYQVKRLRDHPSIVLWCGNNEVEAAWQGWGWKERLPASLWDDYLKLFHDVLPRVCATYDSSRTYWPSSPSSNLEDSPNSQTSGDMHYWGVWHAEKPFEEYLLQTPRFMSEYGFQSFPQISSVNKFTLPEDHALESAVMLTHQKHGRGNQLIRTYALREYDEPKDFASFLYISQIVQAEGIKIGTEHYRRLMPRCMGALYWQIDDCWPVASWSSIDYYGNWKALHYYAKKFYEPILVSPHVANDSVNIYVVSDRPNPVAAEITVTLMKFDGQILKAASKNIWVQPLTSKNYLVINKAEWLTGQDSSEIFLLVELKDNENTLSSNTVFFEPAKNLNLPKPNIDIAVAKSRDGVTISLQSDKLAKNVFLSTDTSEGFFTDNYFNLIPGRKIEIEFKTEQAIAGKAFKDALKIVTLVDAFEAKKAGIVAAK